MGHTDVVPVNADGWSRDPFGGEVVDGMVWGRGAVDMLNLTATMAVAFRQLADSGFKPKGHDLVPRGRRRGGPRDLGRGLARRPRARRRRRPTTSSPSRAASRSRPRRGPGCPVMVEEKGTYWSKLTVRGTPGHASSPYRTDNALVTAAEVVRRLAEFQAAAGAQRHLAAPGRRASACPRCCSQEEGFRETIDQLPLGLRRASRTRARTRRSRRRSCTAARRRTSSPTGWTSRSTSARCPGQSGEHARKLLLEAIGDLADKVEIESGDDPASRSEIDTPLWDALGRVTARLCEGSALVPWLMTGATDNRFFRRAGSVGYGFGLFSKRLAFEDYATMFHGNDERVDQESLEPLDRALARDRRGVRRPAFRLTALIRPCSRR